MSVDQYSSSTSLAVAPAATAEAPSRPSRLVAIGLRVGVLVVCSAFALGVCELSLRVIGFRPAGVAVGDRALGFDSPSSYTEKFDFPEYGGILTMHTNNLGFREDRDTAIAKTPGQRRVVFIGDSQTAGECANTESYPNVLEASLNQEAGSEKFEMINAGVGRYSPYQYYVKTEQKLVQLRPDHIVVGIYVGNDLMDLMRRDDRPYLVAKSDGTMESHVPEFIMMQDPAAGRSFLESSRVVALGRRALGPTLLYQVRRARMLLHDASGHGVVGVARYMTAVKRLTDISVGFMTQSLLQQVWFTRFPETLASAEAVDQEVMRRFKEICDARGIRLTYVLIPTKLTVEPEDFSQILDRVRRYDPSLDLPTLQAFEKRAADGIMRSAAQVGVRAVDLREPLIGLKNGKRFYNPEEMHLTPEGNRAVARALHAALGADF